MGRGKGRTEQDRGMTEQGRRNGVGAEVGKNRLTDRCKTLPSHKLRLCAVKSSCISHSPLSFVSRKLVVTASLVFFVGLFPIRFR